MFTDQYTTQFAVLHLVTDVECWEIVSRTARTLKVRRCARGGIIERRRTGAYDGIKYAVTSDPHQEIRTVRIDKAGYASIARGLGALRAVEVGYEYVDYSY